MKVRIALKQRDARIVPDMGVRVSFLEAAKPDAPKRPAGALVSGDAIVERDGKDVVFVVEGETVVQREVTVGRTLGDDREITKGLVGGETVVLAPTDDLADGARVRVAAEPEPEDSR